MGHLGKSVAQLSALLQTGALDPRELAEETLDAIRTHADQSIFTVLTPERALAEADQSAKRIAEGRSLGILDGIPIAWKDLFDMEGLTTTAGSTVLAKNPAVTADAAIVTTLKQAGMIAVGRTNMSEFAFSGIGINPHYGTPKNPASTDVPRIPGGSSSGAGVSVAAGLVPVAMGTDTGGSIRIPAAFNGIVGYKGTRGRYAMDGVFPLAESLDALGPLCRSVQDAVWVDAAMRGRTSSEVVRGALEGQSLVVPETVFFDGIENGVAAAFEATLERLAKAGARIRRQAFPIFSQLFEMIAERGALVTAEAYALHRERLHGEDAAGMDQRVVSRSLTGQKITAPDYIHILQVRRRMIAEMARSIAPGEILVSPTLPHVAPTIESLITDDAAFFAANGKTLRNTQIGNFLDWCGVSIPCGTGAAGMPVGCLLSGLPNTDEHLLSVALAAEETVRGW
ncbi:hypothetical protein ACO34A_23275 (plasmid) [Rhizobium sp. ACO-34A]|nr:amidase [Rhizobium sp. ACO-34A]ATN36712.1 hypothetical protein ACO34A_23275 [Rhizobium sp. ACO-34A]